MVGISAALVVACVTSVCFSWISKFGNSWVFYPWSFMDGWAESVGMIFMHLQEWYFAVQLWMH